MSMFSFSRKMNKQNLKVNPINKRSLTVKPYEIKNLIIDEESNGDEHVTADFSYQNENYSITLNKSDLELVNAWVFKEGSSLPANLSDDVIEMIREDINKKI